MRIGGPHSALEALSVDHPELSGPEDVNILGRRQVLAGGVAAAVSGMAGAQGFRRGDSAKAVAGCRGVGAALKFMVYAGARLPSGKQAAGATRGYQLSIWRWNAERANPAYVTSFDGMAADPQEGVHIDGDAIRIVQKDHWDILDACGACDGRQVVHRLRLTSPGVSDDGTVSLTPELDLVDEIYTRFRAGQSAEALASPSVLQFMRQSWAPMEHHSFGFLPMLFMNVPETATKKGGVTQLCFRAYYGIRSESMSATLFTFARKGSELRIINAQQNAAGCSP